jgi:hypothetical protein
MMSVGLAVAVGAPLALGVAVMVGVPLALGVVVSVLVRVLATAALLSALEALCSWLSLHPVNPEHANRVKASAV